MTRSVRSILALLALAAFGCGGAGRKAAPPPLAPVAVAVVARRDVPLEVSAVGRVEAFATVSVRPLVGGTVTKVAFREGQDVRAGDLLFEIDPRPYESALEQAKAALERDRARSREADENLKRYAGLVEKDYVTQEQYSQAKADADALRATVKADEAALGSARLNLSWCAVTAPVSGRTGSVLVYAGNVVTANDPKALVVINQVEPIRVSFSVPEKELPEIKRREAAGRLAVRASADTAGPATSIGELTFIDNAVDTTTGTIVLKATFPNRDRALWPGQFTSVTITLANEAGVLVLPSAAVQPGQKGPIVWVIGAGDAAEPRPVTVKRVSGAFSLVEKGFEAGERVVVDGQLRLAPGTKVAVKESPGEAK